MSLGHLLFASATKLYILLAIRLDERNLMATFGDSCSRYRKRVSMLIPLPPRGR